MVGFIIIMIVLAIIFGNLWGENSIRKTIKKQDQWQKNKTKSINSIKQKGIFQKRKDGYITVDVTKLTK